jgi:hypothetical protein
MTARIRLLKVAVQPYFVLDDGTNVVEVEHPPTVIPAAEWPTYSSERFPSEMAEWQARLDAETGVVRDELPRDENGNYGTDQGHGNTIVETVPKPNRAARRTKPKRAG